MLEAGNPLEKRHCPIDGDKVKSCIHCKTCAIMNGFGGAGAFSDGKYNLTNEFGGTLYEYIGKQKAMELMHYVDDINVACGGDEALLHRRQRLQAAVPAKQSAPAGRLRAAPGHGHQL